MQTDDLLEQPLEVIKLHIRRLEYLVAVQKSVIDRQGIAIRWLAALAVSFLIVAIAAWRH